MLPDVKTLLADGGSVCVAVSCVEVAFIDALAARLAEHVFEVINLLSLVIHKFALITAKDIFKFDAVDLLFALWTRILHLGHPFLDARVAVLVSARVKTSFVLRRDFLKTDATSFLLPLLAQLCQRLPIRLHSLAKLAAGLPFLSLLIGD